MKASEVSELTIPEWNTLASCEESFSMMQSWEWGEVKAKLGWTPYRVGVLDGSRLVAGAQVLLKRLPLSIASVAYLPRGPIGHWTTHETAHLLFGKIHEIASRNRAIFLKVEPGVSTNPDLQNRFQEMGFRVSPSTNQPRTTIVMDISPDLEGILRNMRGSTRRKIKSTERKGVRVRLGDFGDLETFYRLMQATARRAGFVERSFDYYEAEFRTFARQGRAALFLAEYEDLTLAAHIAYVLGSRAAFFHQASDPAASALNPNCLLVWEEIKWAKSKGCCSYDLWGVPDEAARPMADDGEEQDSERTDGLWGVYRFKSGFSKNIVSYMEPRDYVYVPLLYNLLNNRLLTGDVLERISTWLDTRRLS
jgi:peptidoglycan pentaglycine glycine transferase (the first glycine)